MRQIRAPIRPHAHVYPAGFLPVRLGSVRRESIVDLYPPPLLRAIRAARFTGRCGACEYADRCGGSRARAFAAFGDPLAEHAAYAYVPQHGGLPTGQAPTMAGASP